MPEEDISVSRQQRMSSALEASFIGGKVRGDEQEDAIKGYQCDIYSDPSRLEINNQQGGNGFDATFKLILIGNSGVGKSCVIKRIGNNSFSEDHEVTIGAEFTTIAAHVDRK